jgi:hypothetical protein
MNCIFCQSPLSSPYPDGMECSSCPILVQYLMPLNNSIGAYVLIDYQDKQYQVIWTIHNNEVQRLSIVCGDANTIRLTEGASQITPANIVSKLPTILNFQ